MRHIISIPIAIAVQNVTPTSQDIATGEAPETKSPTAVSAVPIRPMTSALPAPGGAGSAGRAAEVVATVELIVCRERIWPHCPSPLPRFPAAHAAEHAR